MKIFVLMFFLSSCFTLCAMDKNQSSDENDEVAHSILCDDKPDNYDDIIVDLTGSIQEQLSDDDVDFGKNPKKNCWSKFINLLKKCGGCCSCTCMTLWQGCTRYGKDMSGYQRIGQ